MVLLDHAPCTLIGVASNTSVGTLRGGKYQSWIRGGGFSIYVGISAVGDFSVTRNSSKSTEPFGTKLYVSIARCGIIYTGKKSPPLAET